MHRSNGNRGGVDKIMCIAIPGEIIDLTNDSAKVTIMGAEITVNIELIENSSIGDFVLIHAGCAIEKVDKNYFNEYFNLIKPIYEFTNEEGK